MKNLLFILGIGGTLLVSCSSSSRTGYTYYDDVYDNRPSYSEEKRRSSTIDDRPTYQPSGVDDYNQPGQYDNSQRYRDDEESYYSGSSGSYSDRIRRFNSGNSGFDYYSPYYTGFNDGFNYGVGIGTSYGFSNFGRWGSSLWSPMYSSSIYFGWGRPSWNLGFNSWYTPTYFDPFYGSHWGWNRPWYSSYHSGWNSPWGWGGYHGHHNYPYIDKNPRNTNTYYGPRGGSYGNTYYNGSQFGGKQNNSQPDRNQNLNDGRFKYNPKTAPNKVTPPTTPNRNTSPSTRPSNMPERYSTPRMSAPSNSGNRNTSSPSNNSSGGQRSGGSMQRTNK